MKVSVSKSKNQTIYYLSKSVWVDGKSTTKTIEKIGSEDELLKVCGELTPLEYNGSVFKTKIRDFYNELISIVMRVLTPWVTDVQAISLASS